MSDNSNNVNFSGVRFICSPYLAIKLALASLGPIMSRCGPQMNLNALKMNIIAISSADKVAWVYLKTLTLSDQITWISVR